MNMRRRGIRAGAALAVTAVGGLVLAGCGAGQARPTALSGDSGDRMVFLITSGQGSAHLNLATRIPPDRPRRLTLEAACTGTGDLRAVVHPGSETFTMACGQGNVASDEAGPAALATPRTVTLTAPHGDRWNLAVVDPAGANGVAPGSGR